MSTDSVNVNEVSINGVKYVRADSVPAAETPPTGKRAILVLDRGWIVVGDVDDANGRISVTRAVHVRSWSSIGFDGLVASGGRGSSVVVRSIPNGFDAPADAELFRVPVEDNWGL